MSNTTPPPLRARHGERGEKTHASFGGIEKSAARGGNTGPDFTGIAGSAEFGELRSRLNRFVLPMTALFLLLYIGYVLLAAYAPDFMGEPVFGNINVGLLFGVGQFASTLLITTLYVRFTARRVDPEVDELRETTGGGQR
ncbi:DUF485 domain-containing protein [Actinopolyspora erythraea]|uniref:DUF485 domain-containing protein n=1 Tax=Actinopolyspora erythraea TaxID=414996 RepID=A0A099D8D6_9ACTN|nr:DUF485 domain-containing protein [Actinopolyspora erythraea]ASU80229.1 DUF485 domain-containing protein [Actinopolyspora erythraea]KGI82408.1 hypothetical protein IL38_04555 [Actinopolyspora erythraea]